MTREGAKTADTAATTPGDVYRQARDRTAAQAKYDLQRGLARLTGWMLQDEANSGCGLRAIPANPVNQIEDAGYRGPIACAAAGITYRQLDYWARTGLVEPSIRPAHGSGTQRLYSFRDILVLKVVKRLLDTGPSIQQIRAATAHLRNHSVEDLVQVTLMSDGVNVYECTSPDEVVDLLQGGQGVFGIALGRVWREVEGTLAELPAERAIDAEMGDELANRRRRRDGR